MENDVPFATGNFSKFKSNGKHHKSPTDTFFDVVWAAFS